MNINEQEIQSLIAKLPENIRQAVNNFDWAKEIMDIAHAHYIQIDDIEEFHQETLKVILGISPAEDFEQNIINALHVNKETAGKLVNEANSKIFRQLQRLSFKENHESLVTDNTNITSKPETTSSLGMTSQEFIKTQSFDNDLHKEVSELLKSENQDNSTISKKYEDVKIPSTKSYREPIEESDLRGIKQRNVDTSILKTQFQSQPESLLENNQKLSTNISVKQDQSLDKKLTTTTHISQSDILDISPNEQEVIKEGGSFLEHLSKEEV